MCTSGSAGASRAPTEPWLHGYLVRQQARPSHGRWGRAQEAVTPGAAPSNGRPGFQLLPRLLVDDVRLGGADLLALAAMNSHAPGRPFYPHDLATHFGCHRQTALKILKTLIKLGFVVRRNMKSAQGKFAGSTYRLRDHAVHALHVEIRAKSRDTGKPDSGDEDAYERSPSTKDYQIQTNYAFPCEEGDSDDMIMEMMDWSWLDRLEPRLAQEFDEIATDDIKQRYAEIADAEILELILDASRGRLHDKLKTPEGLSPVRQFMAAGIGVNTVCKIVSRRIGRKPGKFLNGWGVIAAAIASELLMQGFTDYPGDGDDD